MARIVLLNGPAGVGKTTVGRALATLVPNGACVHGDCLKHFVVARVDGAVSGGLGYVNGATVAANFIDAGYDLVVFEYVFEHPSHIDRFLASFRGSAPVHLFTLWAPLHVVIARERARAGRERLGERVIACYRAIEGQLTHLGYRVDTVDLPAGEVAHRIYRLCDAGQGVVAQPLA